MRTLASHWPKNIHVDYGKKPQREENNTSKVEEEVKRKKAELCTHELDVTIKIIDLWSAYLY